MDDTFGVYEAARQVVARLPLPKNLDARDINNASQMVGNARLSDESSHAVLWDGGQIIDLGTLGGGGTTTT